MKSLTHLALAAVTAAVKLSTKEVKIYFDFCDEYGGDPDGLVGLQDMQRMFQDAATALKGD